MDPFNKSRYLELFQEEVKLNQEGSSLFKVKPLEYYEYINYLYWFESQILYNEREKFNKIIKLFFEKKICILEFTFLFSSLRDTCIDSQQELQRDMEALLNFKIEEKSQYFHELITEMYQVPLSLTSSDFLTAGTQKEIRTQFETKLEVLYKQFNTFLSI